MFAKAGTVSSAGLRNREWGDFRTGCWFSVIKYVFLEGTVCDYPEREVAA